jgi:hypothetical protein
MDKNLDVSMSDPRAALLEVFGEARVLAIESLGALDEEEVAFLCEVAVGTHALITAHENQKRNREGNLYWGSSRLCARAQSKEPGPHEGKKRISAGRNRRCTS